MDWQRFSINGFSFGRTGLLRLLLPGRAEHGPAQFLLQRFGIFGVDCPVLADKPLQQYHLADDLLCRQLFVQM